MQGNWVWSLLDTLFVGLFFCQGSLSCQIFETIFFYFHSLVEVNWFKLIWINSSRQEYENKNERSNVLVFENSLSVYARILPVQHLFKNSINPLSVNPTKCLNTNSSLATANKLFRCVWSLYDQLNSVL